GTPRAMAWCRVSFRLPVAHGPQADGAALQFGRQDGHRLAMVVHSHPIGDGFTFFVVYGPVNQVVDGAGPRCVLERTGHRLDPQLASASEHASFKDGPGTKRSDARNGDS